jgi:ferritin
MPARPVPRALITQLQRQFNHELGAAHAYTALAAWCFDRNLKGFARHFYKQAGEEREHAQRFMDHLLDRGVLPELSAIDAPKTAFKTLAEVARLARDLEVANTKGIHAAYEQALKDKDYPAQVMLHWFINEQVEEEAWADEMVTRVEATTSEGGLHALDRHIERYLGDRGPAGEGE